MGLLGAEQGIGQSCLGARWLLAPTSGTTPGWEGAWPRLQGPVGETRLVLEPLPLGETAWPAQSSLEVKEQQQQES